MDKFLHYLENKKFLAWVFSPTKQLNEYWDNYLRINPTEKEVIDLCRLILSQIKSKEEVISALKTTEIFSQIVERIDKKTQQRKIQNFLISLTKFAAIGLIFFLSGIFYYKTTEKTDYFSEIKITKELVLNSDNSQLILSDGSNFPLFERESKINHINKDQIVINKKDTISSRGETEKESYNYLIVPYGKSSSIRLPDGTIAYLNAGSSIKYPSTFDNNKREIYLIGEGYFEVSKDPNKPFHVITDRIEVEVLGTKFNLSAYPTDNVIETILVEGKVELKETGIQFKKNKKTLEPNQRAAYHRGNSEINITEVDINNYVSWHLGYLNFEKMELNRVIKKMEHYYNIRINLKNPMLGMKTITGKLELQENVDSALKVLANTSSVEIVKLNKSTYIIK